MENNETLSQISIRKYIKDDYATGALLISGEWGSGKTFFLKNLAEELNNTKEYVVVTISLFGLSSAKEIEKAVKTELCYIFAAPNGKDQDRKTTNKLVKGLKALTGHFKEDSKFVKTIDDLINFNYWDFVELSPKIKDRKFILIFDDFERCTIDLELLLGIVNEYSENIGIKTFLVADEKKFEEDAEIKNKYNRFKEKVIFKTVDYKQNEEYAIKNIISNFKKEGSNYQRFLYDNIDFIKDTFNRSTYNNYRTLYAAVNEFYNVYAQFIDYLGYSNHTGLKQNEKDALLLMLDQFLALSFESCAGKRIYSELYDYSPLIDLGTDENGVEIGEEFAPETYPDYMEKYSSSDYNFIPKAFIEYIAKGIYNVDNLKLYFSECIKMKTVNEKKPYEVFLYDQLLSIDDDMFSLGFGEALNMAYNGDLISEEYLALLFQIHKAKQNNFILPLKIEYDRIESGYNSKDRVNEKEPVFSVSANRVDEEAESLMVKIIAFINKRPIMQQTKDYYDTILNYFKRFSNNSSLILSNTNPVPIIIDDCLMEAIVKAFTVANNKNKIVIVQSFANINISNFKDKQFADKYIKQLDNKKNELSTKQIEKANYQNFIDAIKKKFRFN